MCMDNFWKTVYSSDIFQVLWYQFFQAHWPLSLYLLCSDGYSWESWAADGWHRKFHSTGVNFKKVEKTESTVSTARLLTSVHSYFQA